MYIYICKINWFPRHTHTHTHTYIYIYICVCVCMCVCVCVKSKDFPTKKKEFLFVQKRGSTTLWNLNLHFGIFWPIRTIVWDVCLSLSWQTIHFDLRRKSRWFKTQNNLRNSFPHRLFKIIFSSYRTIDKSILF